MAPEPNTGLSPAQIQRVQLAISREREKLSPDEYATRRQGIMDRAVLEVILPEAQRAGEAARQAHLHATTGGAFVTSAGIEAAAAIAASAIQEYIDQKLTEVDISNQTPLDADQTSHRNEITGDAVNPDLSRRS